MARKKNPNYEFAAVAFGTYLEKIRREHKEITTYTISKGSIAFADRVVETFCVFVHFQKIENREYVPASFDLDDEMSDNEIKAEFNNFKAEMANEGVIL